MRLLDRVNTVRGRKSFSQAPFWELEASRFAAFGGSSGYLADQEKIENDFAGYVCGAFKDDPVVFAVFDRRRSVFSQASFMWQRLRNGRPTDLFSTPDLDLLREPWPNGSLGELLGHMENDASASGNFYATTVDDFGRIGKAATGPTRRIARMRPDWVTIVINSPSGDPWAVDAKVLAYEYKPPHSGRGVTPSEPLLLLPDEVVHYSPKPDPMARFRGMSWLTPVIREVMADKAASAHKLKFFQNGGVHAMALKYPENTTAAQLREYKAIYDATYSGSDNAFKTFHVAGADPVPISTDMRQLDLRSIQGSMETRIAIAGGVPAVIAGISEGLQGSSLNAGNFGAARRLFVDTTMRDAWSMAGPALQVLFNRPGTDVRLWYDDHDIPFLREDAADDASIKSQDAMTVKTLVDAGYDPDAAVKYVQTGDLTSLVGKHSGLYSVQLQEPGVATPTTEDTSAASGPSLNGRTNGFEVAARR